jgi:serine/threonine-protein kinase
MGALAKEPSARWQSDEELAAALAAAKGQLEGGPNGGQDTAAFAPVPLPAEEQAAAEIAPAADGPPAPPPPPVEERRRRWPLFVIGPLLLALVALLAYLAISSLTAAPQVTVPKVVGKQVLEARTALERAGFDVRQVSVPSSREFGLVVEQDPDPGDEADEGSVVTLEVSRGPGRVRVPSVEGLPEKLALRQLNKAGLKVTLDRRPSDSVREGLAIRTVPKEGAAVDRGTRVRLFVSSGAGKVTVPDVVGLSRGAAEGQLRGKGLEVVVRQQQSDRPADQVIDQSPAAGTRVERGASVTITVATTREEEEQADVPDVVGLSAGQAAGALRSAGFGVARQERRVTDEDDDGKVVAQRPGGGSQVAKGGSVTIVVGKYEEPKAERRREPEPPPGPQPPVP